MLCLGTWIAASAHGAFDVAVLQDASISGFDTSIPVHLASCLTASGCDVQYINTAAMGNAALFNSQLFDMTVIPCGSLLPATVAPNLMNFLAAGGDMVVLGGGFPWFTIPESDRRKLAIHIFDGDYDVYNMANIASICQADGQDVVVNSNAYDCSLTGRSAIASTWPGESAFIPVLKAKDAQDRYQGWAAGLFVNFAGYYANSCWLLFGISGNDFYKTDYFGQVLAEAVTSMRQKNYISVKAAEDAYQRSLTLSITSAAPSGFLSLSGDGRHIVKPDGSLFFATGSNYLQSFDRTFSLYGTAASAVHLEDDFRKASDAGINVLRIWGVGTWVSSSPSRLANLIETARRYNVYLLIHLGQSSKVLSTSNMDINSVVSFNNTIANAFKNEKIVLGYDLCNEPYLSEMAAMLYNGVRSPVWNTDWYNHSSYGATVNKTWVDSNVTNRPDWPKMPSWLTSQQARNLYSALSLWDSYMSWAGINDGSADASVLPGLGGSLPINAFWSEFVNAVNGTVDMWLAAQINAIRAIDGNHLITTGYNTSLSVLPANGRLDFINNHTYQSPQDYYTAGIAPTATNRLAALWSDKPVTLGEFGVSNGVKVEGAYVDIYNSSIEEMIYYLNSYAAGLDGVYKWSLVDYTLPTYRRYTTWSSFDYMESWRSESRFGFYWYDGTLQGRRKPLGAAMKFFRDYADNFTDRGQFSVFPSNTQVNIGYVFQSENALFIGEKNYGDQRVSFDDFDGYIDTAALKTRWYAENSTVVAGIELASDDAGGSALKISYNLGVSPWWGKARCQYKPSVNAWPFGGLRFRVKGGGSGEAFHIGLYRNRYDLSRLYASQTISPIVTTGQWQEVVLDQSDFAKTGSAYDGINFADIEHFAIIPVGGSGYPYSGSIYFDDIAADKTPSQMPVSFTADNASNVMLTHQDNIIKLMSTADAAVVIDAAQLTGGGLWNNPVVDGRFESYAVNQGDITLNVYAGEPVTIISGCAADFNDDGFVDMYDYSLFAFMWINSQSGADINGDGAADVKDINVAAANWLSELCGN